jgi:hypothetical protein
LEHLAGSGRLVDVNFSAADLLDLYTPPESKRDSIRLIGRQSQNRDDTLRM